MTAGYTTGFQSPDEGWFASTICLDTCQLSAALPDIAIAREFSRRLAQRYSSTTFAVKLFGSRARGAADPESDIDLFVAFHGTEPIDNVKEAALDIACELTLEYGILVMPFVADLTLLEQRRGFSFLETVESEGIAV